MWVFEAVGTRAPDANFDWDKDNFPFEIKQLLTWSHLKCVLMMQQRLVKIKGLEPVEIKVGGLTYFLFGGPQLL